MKKERKREEKESRSGREGKQEEGVLDLTIDTSHEGSFLIAFETLTIIALKVSKFFFFGLGIFWVRCFFVCFLLVCLFVFFGLTFISIPIFHTLVKLVVFKFYYEFFIYLFILVTIT